MTKKLLNVVNESGDAIDVDTRENIHAKGLLHMEVNVWFVTLEGKIIFQHRSKTKDTYPDFLDATVGGHVEIGSHYLETAIKETEEETGLIINEEDIKLIKIIKTGMHDHITGKTNNVLKAIYCYIFTGKIENLKSEEEDGVGFESIGLEELRDLDNRKRKKIIPSVTTDVYVEMFEEMVEKKGQKVLDRSVPPVAI